VTSQHRFFGRCATLLTLGLSLTLVGWGRHGADASDNAPTASAQVGLPKAGGDLVFAFDGTAISQFALDPHKSAFAPHARVIRSIFDSLVVLLPDHHFGPWLAKSWEVAPDGLSYTFHLREDVKFHDGTRFDAAAVKFNFDRILEPKNALLALPDIGPYQSSKLLDDFTVEVRLSRPCAPFLANLSKAVLGVVSPAAVQKYGDAFALHPVGTGPFRFDSMVAGTEIALERNPDYRWPPAGATHEGPAWLEHLTFKNVPEEATRMAVLENGQASVVDLVPPQNLLALRSSPDFHVLEGELLNSNYSLFLNVAREPWSEPLLREAFKLSLDIGAAVKTIYLGTAARAWSPLSPSMFGYDKSLENSWQTDRARAARLLDELGWKTGEDGIRSKDGKRLSVVLIDPQGNREKRLDLMTMLRRQLRDNGIDLRIEPVTVGAYLEKASSGDYDLIASSYFAADPDVLRRMYASTTRTLTSVCKANDPELDHLLETGSLELDSERRSKAYADAQRLILDKTYGIPVYVLIYSIAAANKVHGVAIDAQGFPTFNDAWLQ
jgi:peptide/nickel transport system substrate-binding protein